MAETVEQLLAHIKYDSEIHCPHCDAHYEDEEYQHISYHKVRKAKRVECESCKKKFWLEEHVSRTYTTAATRAGLEE